MSTVQDSASQVLVLGTIHLLDTIASVTGTYQLLFSLSDLILGDEIQATEATKVRNVDSFEVSNQVTYLFAPTKPVIRSIPLVAEDGIEYSIQQLRATFTITSMTGTVAVGDTVTGATSAATGIVRFMDNPTTPTSIIIEWLSGTWQDAENAEVDGSNFLVLNDATPAQTISWKTWAL
ncbi:MAG: hypothetical protein V3V40_06335 [Nitrosomonadaceae bacterium]